MIRVPVVRWLAVDITSDLRTLVLLRAVQPQPSVGESVGEDRPLYQVSVLKTWCLCDCVHLRQPKEGLRSKKIR